MLQLWTRGNYHWHSKQELRVGGVLVQPAWSGEDPNVIRFLWVGRRSGQSGCTGSLLSV